VGKRYAGEAFDLYFSEKPEDGTCNYWGLALQYRVPRLKVLGSWGRRSAACSECSERSRCTARCQHCSQATASTARRRASCRRLAASARSQTARQRRQRSWQQGRELSSGAAAHRLSQLGMAGWVLTITGVDHIAE
jgi:hypothetical protein